MVLHQHKRELDGFPISKCGPAPAPSKFDSNLTASEWLVYTTASLALVQPHIAIIDSCIPRSWRHLYYTALLLHCAKQWRACRRIQHLSVQSLISLLLSLLIYSLMTSSHHLHMQLKMQHPVPVADGGMAKKPRASKPKVKSGCRTCK